MINGSDKQQRSAKAVYNRNVIINTPDVNPLFRNVIYASIKILLRLKPRHILLSYCSEVVAVRRDKLFKEYRETPSKGNVKFTTSVIYDCYYFPKYNCLPSPAPSNNPPGKKNKKKKMERILEVDKII